MRKPVSQESNRKKGKENRMNRPEWVFFDYGGTLIDNGPFDLQSGMEGLRLASENPGITTTAEMCRLWNDIGWRYEKRLRTAEGLTVDIHLQDILRSIFARLGLRFSVPLHECELIFDRYNSNPARIAVQGIETLLSALERESIPAAVISNTELSGKGMHAILNEALPENRMKFVLTSADYLFAKPAPDMFMAAASLAGVKPEDCWYCGNDIQADAGGAGPCGMLPCIINLNAEKDIEEKTYGEIHYIQVRDWNVLAAVLSGLKE